MTRFVDNKAVYGPNIGGYGVKIALADPENSRIDLISGQDIEEPLVINLLDEKD